ncbi:ATP-binding cassette domain-containing protein [Leucothrix arctica]|uniref:Probable ATP-binding protein YheS n=1 Tax=Leucothrix arctica TaxID=1481894 RepID=A0A317CER7_9GAMM|nr:ATP-binding cassette domain-containing protein [Leucothrix arctica]PWQ94622.1 ABC transporter ATP-binding protein [Leucothrix arctica]
MLVFSDISLRRGGRELIGDSSFSIHPGQKVGLTGANGTGKSSLFALIRGELGLDGGQFNMPPNWVMAHVAQHTPDSDQSALSYALEGDSEFTSLQEQMKTAEGEHLATLIGQLDAIDGYTTESRAASLLQGLGFKNEQIHNPVSSFSGGWRMRLNLVQALMCRSDLLLLDEPTNHLDLDAVIWLQQWLIQYQGTLILISHDREFLDAVTTHVCHLEHHKLTLYTGNYSAFEKVRAERLAQQQSTFERQQREVAHIRKYVDRFRAQATKARQAQSRLKALDRMELVAQAHIDSPFKFGFFEPRKLPDRLLNITEASIGYGDTPIVTKVDFELMPGQRIGLIGPNGAGKSTLIKCLAGELPVQAGELWCAQDLHIGYFAQHQVEQLHLDQTPLEHMRILDKEAREQDLRNYLGGFGFQGERVDEAVAPFSGGEKARLVLALLVYQRPNLLLLDEPTNHLDLDMRHALSMALQVFEGAMVIVSHDRHLLKSVTDEYVIVEGGFAKEFDGDLDDYSKWLSNREKELAAVDKVEDKTVSRKDQRKHEADMRKQLQPLKRIVDKHEKELDKLIEQSAALEKQLADPDIYLDENKEALKSLLLKKRDVDAGVEKTEAAWLDASEEYEQAMC